MLIESLYTAVSLSFTITILFLPFLHCPLQLLMFLLALFLLLFHCFIKPYKKETSNVVETLVLLNLLLVAAVYMEAPQDEVASVFIVILTLLPYLYAVGFLMWLAGRKMLVSMLLCTCIIRLHSLSYNVTCWGVHITAIKLGARYVGIYIWACKMDQL